MIEKKKRKLENELRNLQQQMRFFSDVEKENQELEVSQIINDSLAGKANELISSLSSSKNDLIALEKDYVNESNKLTFFNQRLSVVSKVKRNHKKQVPR